VTETARNSLVDLDSVGFRSEVLVDSVRDSGENDDGDTDAQAVGEECSSSNNGVLGFAFEAIEDVAGEV